MQKTLPLNVQYAIPALVIADNANTLAYGDEAVAVLLEVTNATKAILTGTIIQAAGFGEGGYLAASDETAPLIFWPMQTRLVRLVLRPLTGPIGSVCIYATCDHERVTSSVLS